MKSGFPSSLEKLSLNHTGFEFPRGHGHRHPGAASYGRRGAVLMGPSTHESSHTGPACVTCSCNAGAQEPSSRVTATEVSASRKTAGSKEDEGHPWTSSSRSLGADSGEQLGSWGTRHRGPKQVWGWPSCCVHSLQCLERAAAFTPRGPPARRGWSEPPEATCSPGCTFTSDRADRQAFFLSSPLG